MIEQVLITTVPRKPNVRRWFSLGVLEALGYPVNDDRLKFFDAHNNVDYENADAVRLAAVADGFSFFKDSEIQDIKSVLPGPLATCTYFWTFCSVYRQIAESGKTTLQLVDDIMPKCRFDIMRKMVEEVYNSDLLGIQLCVRPLTKTVKSVRHDAEIVTSSLGRGFVSENDYGFLLTPHGAQMLLDEVQKKPYRMFYKIARDLAHQDVPGLYHTLESVLDYSYQLPRAWKEHEHYVEGGY